MTDFSRPSDIFTVHAYKHTDGHCNVTGYSVTAQQVAVSPERAEEIARCFPKSWRVQATRLYSSNEILGLVCFRVQCSPDRVQGDKNETGLARIRNFFKRTQWTFEQIAGNSMTPAEFYPLIAQIIGQEG